MNKKKVLGIVGLLLAGQMLVACQSESKEIKSSQKIETKKKVKQKHKKKAKKKKLVAGIDKPTDDGFLLKGESQIIGKNADGIIVKHGEHEHFFFYDDLKDTKWAYLIPKDGKTTGTISSTHHISNAYSTNAIVSDDGYRFNFADVVSETTDGYVVKHGDHFHFIPKTMFSLPMNRPLVVRTPVIPRIPNLVGSISPTSEKNWSVYFLELKALADQYHVRTEDVKLSGNVIVVPHGNHSHAHFSAKISDWSAFLDSHPEYALVGKPSEVISSSNVSVEEATEDKKDWSDYEKEIKELALKYGVSAKDVKISGQAIVVPHGDHHHIYISEHISDWTPFVKANPQYQFEGKLETPTTEKKELPELDPNDLVSSDELKFRINMELDREDFQHPISFEDLEKLTSLDLFGSGLEDFRFLVYAKNLIELNVGNNPAFSQNDLDYLKKMTSLKSLVLDGNSNITDLEPIQHLKLESLSLSETGVPSLYQIKPFKSLKKLNASLLGAHDHNHSEGGEHDHSSKKSDRHEELSAINASVLAELTEMEELDVSGNSLMDLSFVKNMPNLKKLYAEGSYLETLSGIDGSHNLEVLGLSNNEITSIAGIEKQDHLTSVDLTLNHISDISYLSGRSQLKSLKLGYNQLENVNLSNLPKLEELQLKNNNLSDLSSLSNVVSLTHLQVDNNNLTNFSFVEKLVSLISLSASENQVTNLKPLLNLPNIQELIINNNAVDDISSFEQLMDKGLFNLSVNDQIIKRIAKQKEEVLLGEDVTYELSDKAQGAEITQQGTLIQKDNSIVTNPVEVTFESNKNSYNGSYAGKILVDYAKVETETEASVIESVSDTESMDIEKSVASSEELQN
ncbi:pneumococcal-type histidine triad protein [Streptococcus pluranimalium]|uniref:pneumococcal-type histidine triad protein n=1 Tax=Streptococcus pluranimalium TaxID=82348 RepID=UPI003F68FFC6